MRHVFTKLAPDSVEPESNDEFARSWEWCIRCGVLRLGSQLFAPGPNQQKVVLPGVGDNSCQPRKEPAND